MNSQHQYIVVEEGVNVRLACEASGSPTPLIQWHRPDGLPIHTGYWHGEHKIIFFFNEYLL